MSLHALLSDNHFPNLSSIATKNSTISNYRHNKTTIPNPYKTPKPNDILIQHLINNPTSSTQPTPISLNAFQNANNVSNPRVIPAPRSYLISNSTKA